MIYASRTSQDFVRIPERIYSSRDIQSIHSSTGGEWQRDMVRSEGLDGTLLPNRCDAVCWSKWVVVCSRWRFARTPTRNSRRELASRSAGHFLGGYELRLFSLSALFEQLRLGIQLLASAVLSSDRMLCGFCLIKSNSFRLILQPPTAVLGRSLFHDFRQLVAINVTSAELQNVRNSHQLGQGAHLRWSLQSPMLFMFLGFGLWNSKWFWISSLQSSMLFMFLGFWAWKSVLSDSEILDLI